MIGLEQIRHKLTSVYLTVCNSTKGVEKPELAYTFHRTVTVRLTHMSFFCFKVKDHSLYPVYTIEQTSSRRQPNVEQTSSWLVQLTYSQLVKPA